MFVNKWGSVNLGPFPVIRPKTSDHYTVTGLSHNNNYYGVGHLHWSELLTIIIITTRLHNWMVKRVAMQIKKQNVHQPVSTRI